MSASQGTDEHFFLIASFVASFVDAFIASAAGMAGRRGDGAPREGLVANSGSQVLSLIVCCFATGYSVYLLC